MELQAIGWRRGIDNKHVDLSITHAATSTDTSPPAAMIEQSIDLPIDDSKNLETWRTILACSHISLAVGGFTVSRDSCLLLSVSVCDSLM
jgi:hypothetical protein